jgi:GntR family transcriptional regulator, galactonate operon transcriptional repressor
MSEDGSARRYGRGLHGEVVETIGTRIASGWYRPGDQLLSEPLETELNVSKTVVREALRVLAAKGLVDPRPKRGTQVRPREAWSLLDPDLLYWQSKSEPNPAFLQDLSEVRFIIEPEAARLAALRRTRTDLEAMEQSLQLMAACGEREAVSPQEVVAADLSFHRALLGAAHNELLSRMEAVIEAGLRIRDQMVHGGGRGADALDVHRAVFLAVSSGDSGGAVEATRKLLLRASKDVAYALVNGNGGARRRRPAASSKGKTGKEKAGSW